MLMDELKKQVIKSRYTGLFLMFYLILALPISAQETKLVIYPGEGYQNVLAETTDGLTQPLGWVHGPSVDVFKRISTNKWDREDLQGAYTFRTEIMRGQDTSSLPDPKKTISLDMVHFWAVDSLQSSYRTRGKDLYKMDLRNVLRDLTDGAFQETDIRPKKVIHGDWLRNIIPCTYQKKICVLLWDEADKMTIHRSLEQELSSNELEFSLRDARHMALCRYDENCYVLLLITKPIIGLNN